jgi:hypothetical protein
VGCVEVGPLRTEPPARLASCSFLGHAHHDSQYSVDEPLSMHICMHAWQWVFSRKV